MATRRIYLVRHGEYNWDDQSSAGLTELGRKQAKLTAKRIRSLEITSVYSSDLPRAIETAEIICREIDSAPFKVTAVLRECYLPGPPFAKVPRRLLKAGQTQANAAFSKYFRATRGKDKNELIVSHGNLIRYFVSRVIGVSQDIWFRMGTRNCGITEIMIESNGRMRLVSYNDVGHLHGQLMTYGLPRGTDTASRRDRK